VLLNKEIFQKVSARISI